MSNTMSRSGDESDRVTLNDDANSFAIQSPEAILTPVFAEARHGLKKDDSGDGTQTWKPIAHSGSSEDLGDRPSPVTTEGPAPTKTPEQDPAPISFLVLDTSLSGSSGGGHYRQGFDSGGNETLNEELHPVGNGIFENDDGIRYQVVGGGPGGSQILEQASGIGTSGDGSLHNMAGDADTSASLSGAVAYSFLVLDTSLSASSGGDLYRQVFDSAGNETHSEQLHSVGNGIYENNDGTRFQVTASGPEGSKVLEQIDDSISSSNDGSDEDVVLSIGELVVLWEDPTADGSTGPETFASAAISDEQCEECGVGVTILESEEAGLGTALGDEGCSGEENGSCEVGETVPDREEIDLASAAISDEQCEECGIGVTILESEEAGLGTALGDEDCSGGENGSCEVGETVPDREEIDLASAAISDEQCEECGIGVTILESEEAGLGTALGDEGCSGEENGSCEVGETVPDREEIDLASAAISDEQCEECGIGVTILESEEAGLGTALGDEGCSGEENGSCEVGETVPDREETDFDLPTSTAQGEGQEPIAQIDHVSGLDPTDQLLQLILGDTQSGADGNFSNHAPGNSAVNNEVESDSEGTGAGIEDSLSVEAVFPQHVIIDGQKFIVSPKKPTYSIDMGQPLTEDITIFPEGDIPSNGDASDVTADSVTSLGALEANNLTGSQDLLDLGVELFA